MIKDNYDEAVYFQNKSAATQILVKENLLSNLKKIKNSIEDGKTIRKKKNGSYCTNQDIPVYVSNIFSL